MSQNLDELLNSLIAEEVPEDIYDADKFPPRFQPGQRVRFLFRLEDEPVTLSADNKTLRLNYKAEAMAIITKTGEQPIPAMSNGEQPTLRFQSADSRTGQTQDGNIIPSRLHRLFRSLVGRDQAKLTGTDPRLIVQAIRALDGTETFDATVGWKLYSADTQTEYATSTSKSRSYEKQDGTTAHYEPWPTEDGGPARTVDGEYPRDCIVNFIEKKPVKVGVGA